MSEICYDIAFIGGGLAGLTAAILLARQGWQVALFEKRHYPFHKVCGEYLAEESLPLLQRIGILLTHMQLPRINRALVSSPTGTCLEFSLRQGGIGLSRYRLEQMLYEQARLAGVAVYTGTLVKAVTGQPGAFLLQTSNQAVSARLVGGSWGRYSRMDIYLQRKFTAPRYRAQAFIGVKYHIQIEFPRDQVALHGFPGGYCGLSAIEEDKYCMAYIAPVSQLKACGGQIKRLEQEILAQNPHVRQILNTRKTLYDQPLVISQLHFLPRSTAAAGILMLGDSAGVIAPLCGNGMSMALRTAQLLAELAPNYLRGTLTFTQLEKYYKQAWQKLFYTRLLTGRWLQWGLRQPWRAELLIRSLQPFPKLVASLHERTHGQPF